MNRNIFSRWMILPLMAILAVLACGAPVSVASTPEPTNTQEIPVAPEDTATVQVQPTFTVEVTQQPTTAGAQPSCTVLQDLNLRSGPGTAYRPAIRVLPPNSTLTPLGFAPQGLVGGSWAYVKDRAAQDEGWVSAGSQFISCDVDLSTLPSVTFGTPQAYVPTTSQVSPGPGTCGKGGVVSDNAVDVYDCSVEFSDGFPTRFIILKNGQEAGRADGVQNVFFLVDQNGTEIYSRTENDAAYCVFGGNDPCVSWVFEDYVYKWETGGVALETGTYTLNIIPTLDDPSVNLFWKADITVTVPK